MSYNFQYIDHDHLKFHQIPSQTIINALDNQQAVPEVLNKQWAYYRYKLIRRTEEEIERLYPSDLVKSPIHLSIGQEAIAVGVMAALGKQDVVFSNYRSHAHYLAKGGRLPQMFAELFGKENGGSAGIGGSMHLTDMTCNFLCTSAIVASSISNAAGFALAEKNRRDFPRNESSHSSTVVDASRVTVCFHGDGAVEEGVFWETMNFAALKKLPIIFILENNKYAIYTHQRARQPQDNICERVASFGIHAKRVEGRRTHDFYNATVGAVNHIRTHQQPVLLEMMTHRFRDHVGPGEDRQYGFRSDAELNQAIKEDELPLIASELSNEIATEINHKVEMDIAAAIEFAHRGDFPNTEALLRNVYA